MERATGVIKVALLGILPPPSGGIASWTKRMLNSQEMRKGSRLFLVDEHLVSGRAVFGEKSRRNYFDEVKRCARIWGDLSRCIKQNGTEVVHANIPAFTLSMMRECGCALVSRKNGAKFVIHFRCTVPIAASSSLSRFVLKRLLRLSDSVIVLNEVSRRFVESISSVPVVLIPNFVSDADIPDVDFNETVNRGPLKKVLYAGGIVEEKGILDIAKVASLMPDVEFRMAGQGGFPRGYDVPSNIVLLGSLSKEELVVEYSNADAFLFLSRYRGEGFSNSLLEAMSFGLPCVVTDWAANADMVGANNSLVVDCGKDGDVFRALRSLDDARLRIEIGQYNYNRVRELYCESVVASQYIETYKGVLDEND